MRKFAAGICAAVMALGMAVSAAAAPSIGALIPEAPAVVGGAVREGYQIVIKDADTTNYTNREVADAIDRFNNDDDSTVSTHMDVLKALNLDLTQEFTTVNGTVIDPAAYEPLMAAFVDIKEESLTDVADFEYTIDGAIKVTMKIEVLKDLDNVKAEDMVIMLIDPETGDVYFIEIEDYDPETGAITAEFPCLGAFTVIAKTEAIEQSTEPVTE